MVFHFRQLRQTSFTAINICKVNDKVKTEVQETLLNEAIESSLDWCAAALGEVRDGVLQRDIEPGYLAGVRNDHRNNFYAITRLRRCIRLIDWVGRLVRHHELRYIPQMQSENSREACLLEVRSQVIQQREI